MFNTALLEHISRFFLDEHAFLPGYNNRKIGVLLEMALAPKNATDLMVFLIHGKGKKMNTKMEHSLRILLF